MKILIPASLLQAPRNRREFRQPGRELSKVIAKMADGDKFNRIVMGLHGDGPWPDSVATKVLAFTKMPVLLVR